MSGAVNDQNIAQLAQAVNLFAYITVCLVDWYCWEAILPAFFIPADKVIVLIGFKDDYLFFSVCQHRCCVS